MKAFLWVVLLGIIGVSFYFIIIVAKPDNSRQIALMFGNTNEDQMEIHVELTMTMAGEDVYPYVRADGSTDWEAWAKDHYVLTDTTGNQVDFRKNTKSNLLPRKDEMRGYYDSFLIGKIKHGESYTFKYVPNTSEPNTAFEYKFDAPSEDGRSRVRFEPL